MTILLLKLRYSFNMVLAYLSGMMRDTVTMDAHVREADKVWLELWKVGGVR